MYDFNFQSASSLDDAAAKLSAAEDGTVIVRTCFGDELDGAKTACSTSSKDVTSNKISVGD